MASKILGRSFDAPIKPYNFEGKDYNTLRVYVDYSPVGGYFYARLTPELIEDKVGGFRSRSFVISGTKDPLGSWTTIKLKDAPRNSGKTIYETSCALEMAKTAIGYFFDQRDWQTLTWLVESVGTAGYTHAIEQKCEELMRGSETENNNESINDSNNEKIMAENVNAQEYVGKVIIVGENIATITIKGVKDNGNLDGEFRKGDAAPIPMAVTIANLKGMVERGVWRFEGEATATESKDDVQEVEDVQPTPKTEPKAEKPKTEKPKTEKPKTEKPKAEPKPKQPKAKPEVQADGTLTYETYTSKKGKTCARILGFGEKDEAYVNAADIHGSASWMTADGKRTLYIAFGAKYVEKAKAVCDALNEGKSLADCKAIIASSRPSGTSGEISGDVSTTLDMTKPKTYTEAEVADLLKRVIAGEQEAIDLVNAMTQAA